MEDQDLGKAKAAEAAKTDSNPEAQEPKGKLKTAINRGGQLMRRAMAPVGRGLGNFAEQEAILVEKAAQGVVRAVKPGEWGQPQSPTSTEALRNERLEAEEVEKMWDGLPDDERELYERTDAASSMKDLLMIKPQKDDDGKISLSSEDQEKTERLLEDLQAKKEKNPELANAIDVKLQELGITPEALNPRTEGPEPEPAPSEAEAQEADRRFEEDVLPAVRAVGEDPTPENIQRAQDALAHIGDPKLLKDMQKKHRILYALLCTAIVAVGAGAGLQYLTARMVAGGAKGGR